MTAKPIFLIAHGQLKGEIEVGLLIWKKFRIRYESLNL